MDTWIVTKGIFTEIRNPLLKGTKFFAALRAAAVFVSQLGLDWCSCSQKKLKLYEILWINIFFRLGFVVISIRWPIFLYSVSTLSCSFSPSLFSPFPLIFVPLFSFPVFSFPFLFSLSPFLLFSFPFLFFSLFHFFFLFSPFFFSSFLPFPFSPFPLLLFSPFPLFPPTKNRPLSPLI